MILQANPKAGFTAAKVEFLEAAARALDSGWYILGEEVESFEKEFAAWSGVPHAVACANGTDAIELILRGMGIGAGDVVFTVSHTAVATVAAVERAGATPWMVDVEAERLTMSPAALESAVTQCRAARPDLRPKAVMPVHIYGQCADMDALSGIAAAHGLALIEDCAQAHGAENKGRKAGQMSQAAAFSLYPTKNLGAFGDAGIVITPEAALAEEMRCLRQYGWRERYISAVSGINSRMDPLQAAFLRIKLVGLDEDNAARRRIAAKYDELLSPLEDKGLLAICRPFSDNLHVYHQYVIRVERRDELAAYCREHGVGSAVHYPVPVHEQPAYLDRTRFPLGGVEGPPAPELPESERAAREVLSLPMYPQLSEAEVEEVAAVIRAWGDEQ